MRFDPVCSLPGHRRPCSPAEWRARCCRSSRHSARRCCRPEKGGRGGRACHLVRSQKESAQTKTSIRLRTASNSFTAAFWLRRCSTSCTKLYCAARWRTPHLVTVSMVRGSSELRACIVRSQSRVWIPITSSLGSAKGAMMSITPMRSIIAWNMVCGWPVKWLGACVDVSRQRGAPCALDPRYFSFSLCAFTAETYGFF